MTDGEVLLQQLITGLSNGMIIALIALGYTMVYGIVELINFAHGDLFMLGAFLALTLVGLLGLPELAATPLGSVGAVALLFVAAPLFCAAINWSVDRFAYRPLRNAPRLAPLVSAIGVSFIFLNFGLFWGGLPMDVFNMGNAAASPKDFPQLLPDHNLLGESFVQLTMRDLLVFIITIPLMALLTWFVKGTKMGQAMRAVAQNQTAARLMGIDVNRTIGITFIVGGALAGVASVMYALYNGSIFFQMGYRVGIDAFTAAVLGGIGSLPGALLGGLLIGLVRAMSDQYLAASWTNVVVFSLLIVFLVFRPSGLLGKSAREKV
jgi:branched-chain amino acid transport system permease protein